MAVTALFYGDTHGGSTVALCPPKIIKDDGGEYRPSSSQRWLWENWLKLIEKASGYDNLISVLNGDAGEGDTKDRSYQVITKNPATLMKILIEIHEPIRKASKKMYVTRGTTAHIGKSGNIEESLAYDLGCEKTETGAYSAYQWNLNIEGLRIDVAHHVTMGGMPWTRKDAASKLAARVLFGCAEREEKPPDLVFRSHVHRWADSYDAYPVRAIILPCWQLATEYTHKIAPGAVADIGACFVHIDGRHYEVDKFKVEPRRKVWTTV